ncbi:perforin-1-like [Tachyglossus aculeatus]|uniref:perforin-1-like n=1 Tax=Tachyglossus aculeatus TaxID=9261 RepID=UPI0018F55096|nr:perforin-1-like [Tachyglossus aculeatus]
MDSCFLLFLFFLLLLPVPIPAPCHTATRAECKKHQKFIPGSQLAGEGVDVTTLQPTGFFPVDLNKYLRKDGTCTLCRNDHQGGELQRLPLAVTDWLAETTKCQRAVAKSMARSAIEVASSAAKKIQNNWKADLNVTPKPGANVQVSVAGSHSKEANFAAGKLQEDKYIFTSDTVECRYYRFRLIQLPPLQFDFKRAMHFLPDKFTPSTQTEYFKLIANFGTHFMSSVELGGRTTDITALRTCKLTLDGVTADEVADCLAVEAAVSVAGKGEATVEDKRCKEENKKHNLQGSFHETYNERHVEVVGGQHESITDMIFGATREMQQFSTWMATLPASPGLVTYSLSPLHFLLHRNDPRKEELRQAVSEYIIQKARWQNCTRPCPVGKVKSAHDPCRCVCHESWGMNEECCPKNRGLAKLEVKIIKASGLWGDYFTSTDAYVKVFFGGHEQRTPTIWNNNNPVWQTNIDFGPVQLNSGGPLRVQVWDADNGWDDDLLGTCDRTPHEGASKIQECYLNHGSVSFQYDVTCAPHLRGSTCQDYAQQGLLGKPVGNRSGEVW